MLITSQGNTCPQLNLLVCLPNLLLLCMFIRQADKTHENTVRVTGVVEDQLSMGRQGNCSCQGEGIVKCMQCAVKSGPWNKQWRGGPATTATGTRGWIRDSFRQAQADHEAIPSGSKGPGNDGRVFLQGRSSAPSRLLSKSVYWLEGLYLYCSTAVLQPWGKQQVFSQYAFGSS